MEHSRLEFKLVWKDEYLATVCAFANTSGGVLEIGKNDVGEVVGLVDAKVLLNVIPQKISNAMMISADVALHNEGGKDYLSIDVTPHPFAIACKGKYYKRSGSTTIELTGNGLSEFLLRRQGKTWDGVPIPNVSVNDLSASAFEVFRKKAIQSKRLKKEDADIPIDALLENLNLKENGFMKRAATMCFGADPEKWVMGACVKLGYFDNDVDVRYQDEVHGSLIEIADKTLDLLYTKYLKGWIRYEGLQRIEDFLVPYEAMREAVLNAIIHNDYSYFTPISIRVYEHQVIISNMAKLPEDISFKELLVSRRSFLHNPCVATVFYYSGQIERWGRGINKIKIECKKEGVSKPFFRNKGIFFEVKFVRNQIYTDNSGGINGGINDGINDGINEIQTRLIGVIRENPVVTVPELAEKVGIAYRTVERNLKFLKDNGIIEREGAKKKGKWIVKK
jgi:ATP-dependent DNA helicase RecG